MSRVPDCKEMRCTHQCRMTLINYNMFGSLSAFINYSAIFANLSESDCSHSKLGSACLETRCLLQLPCSWKWWLQLFPIDWQWKKIHAITGQSLVWLKKTIKIIIACGMEGNDDDSANFFFALTSVCSF